MPHDEAAAVLPRGPNDIEKLLMDAKRYVLAFSVDVKNKPEAIEIADDLLEKIDAALTAGPRGDLTNGTERADLAKMVFDYYTGEIGRLMHQAEHWAQPEVEHPLAVHHRVRAADELFQVVNLFDADRLTRGWQEPFTEIEKQMATPYWGKEPGTYPPSVALHKYRDPRFVVERLNALLAEGKNRG